MSPSPFFSNRITKARTICYIVLLVLQVVLLGLVADYTVWVQRGRGLDYIYLVSLLLTLISLTVLFIVLFVFLFPRLLRYESVVHTLWWEAGWLWILSVPWVFVNWAWGHDTRYVCDGGPSRYNNFNQEKLCGPLKTAITVFVIINCAVVLGLAGEALAYGLYQRFALKRPQVWKARPGQALEEKKDVDLGREDPYAHVA